MHTDSRASARTPLSPGRIPRRGMTLMPASLLVRMFFWLWFGAAIAAGHFLVLQRLPPIAAQGITLGIAALLFIAYNRVSAVRTWVDSLDLRALILLHVTRFIGIYLL